MFPIEGARFKCKTCPDFDYCENCFRVRRTHRHPFQRYDEPGSIPVNVGKPGRGRKRLSASPSGTEVILKEWTRIVRNLAVSSRENHASRLLDTSDSYWQSSGSQGKVSGLMSRFKIVSLCLCRFAMSTFMEMAVCYQ